MKNLITVGLFILMTSFSFGQNFVGMVKASDSTWIDQIEVTLADYYDYVYQRLFLFEEYENISIESLLPDTAQMPDGIGAFFDFFIKSGNEMEVVEIASPRNNAEIEFGIHFSNQVKDINDLVSYPITGITYDQAVDYINWRNALLQKDPGTQGYECRLASYEELKTITMKGLNQKKKEVVLAYLTTGKNKKGCQLINYKNDSPCASDVEYRKGGHPSGMMKSIAYWPNSLGVRNLQGNVSEMTAEKGIAFGGNYTLPFEECKPESMQTYTHPTPWLGFRCIVVKK